MTAGSTDPTRHANRDGFPARGGTRSGGGLAMSAGAIVVCGGAVAGGLLMTAPASAAAAPRFQLPFPCGQTWSGQTRSNHSPARHRGGRRAPAGRAVGPLSGAVRASRQRWRQH